MLRASSAEGRFEAFHASGLIELVGREEELELLLRRWSKAKRGEGQVVLLSGEPGIGKSRLTAALLEHLAGEPHTRLRYFCSPQYTLLQLPFDGNDGRRINAQRQLEMQSRRNNLEILSETLHDSDSGTV